MNVKMELFCGEWRPQYLEAPLIPVAFQQCVAQRPNEPCLIAEDGASLSYAQVDAAATSLARRLVARGVGRDTAVGILFDRAPSVVVSMIAVHKAGGCYVPLDPNFPADRLSIYIEDSEAVALLTEPCHTKLAMSLISPLPTFPQILLYEDPDDAAACSDVVLPELSCLSADDLAYIMFTSGSTGRPKGVMINHRGVRDLVVFNVEKFGLSPADVFCLNSTVCFDSYVTYVFASLVVGGRLVVPGPSIHLDPSGMASLIASHGITIMEVVPALAAEYMRAFKEAGDSLACLKHILTGGEALTPNLASTILSTLPGLKQGGLFNSYGPTEVTVTTITGHITPPCDRIPLGRPDHNVHTYVVVEDKLPSPDLSPAGPDEAGPSGCGPDKPSLSGPRFRLAGIGEPGELWLSGPRLARGYRNRPVQTLTAFVPNPFFDQAVAGLPEHAQQLRQHYSIAYRTADLVVMGGDGKLEYLGRVDHQIKINGVRMEISEVEAVLAGAPGVTHAAVKPWKDASGTYRLAGYVAPASVDLAAAETHCRSKLLPAMVPSKLVSLAVMPRLPNGKIDVKSLEEPEWVAAGGAGGGDGDIVEAPTNDMEELLTGIWADELRVEPSQLSTKHNFFALGGNSLRAGLINTKLRRATGVDISGLLIYQHSSVTAMAAAIERQHGKFSMEGESSKGSFSVIGAGSYRHGSATGSNPSFSVATSTESKDSNDERWANSSRFGAKGAAAPGTSKPWALPVWLATLLQVSGLLLLGYLAWGFGVAGLEAIYWFSTTKPPLYVLFLLGAGFMFFGMFSLLAFTLAVKWALLGRVTPRTVPIWGWFYVRWWIVRVCVKTSTAWVFPLTRRTPMLPWYFRALGAKIGRNVVIDSANISDWDLIEIGDDTVIETDAFLAGASFYAGAREGDRGRMVLSKTSVGKGCTLMPTSIVSEGTHLADGCILTPGNTSARPPAGPSDATAHAEVRTELGMLPLPLALLTALVMLLLTSLLWVTIIPSLLLWIFLAETFVPSFAGLHDDPSAQWAYLMGASRTCWIEGSGALVCYQIWKSLAIGMAIAPITGFVMANFYMWLMVPIKYVLVGKMTHKKMTQGGMWMRFRRHLWRCFLKGPFQTTVYTWTSTEVFNAWLRALGAKVGRQCWLSEMFRCSEFEMYEVADTASVCSLVTVIGSSNARTERIRLGEACDVTNDCTLMPGVTVGQSAVTGVFTYGAPRQVFADGSITLGEFCLKKGGHGAVADLESGGNPDDKLDCAADRLIPTWQYVVYNVLYGLGAMTVFTLTNIFMMLPGPLLSLFVVFMYGYWISAAWVPVFMVAGFFVFLGYLALLKRVVMRNAGGSHPIFTSVGAGKWQMMCINCHLYGDFDMFKGSLMYNWYLRAMGTKVGKEVFCLGGVVAEYEQVTLGDGAVLGDGTFLLTHTVENRRVKIRPIVIGKRVTCGSLCAVLPDASMEDGADLADMSLVMKGETVPRSAAWSGVPACTSPLPSKYAL